MIDAHNALRAHLILPSDLRTLLGGNYVYTPEIPDNVTMPRKAISFRGEGGQTFSVLRAQDMRVVFKCWGSSSAEARQVYGELYDRLHDQQNFIVGDVGFHGIEENVPGSLLEDPKTGWPYVHTVYTVRVATIPVSAA